MEINCPDRLGTLTRESPKTSISEVGWREGLASGGGVLSCAWPDCPSETGSTCSFISAASPGVWESRQEERLSTPTRQRASAGHLATLAVMLRGAVATGI